MFENTGEKIRKTAALIEAIHENDFQFVKNFFGDSENLQYANVQFNGIPIIIFAAQEKKWEIFKVLFNSDANLDIPIEYAQRYVIYECIDSAPEKITSIIMEYCDLNVQNRQGNTPLMYAYQKNKKYVVDHLIDKVDLSKQNNNRDTFAHLVAKNKDYDLFLRLTQLNAPIQILNNDGLSAIDCVEDTFFKEQLPKMLSLLAKDAGNKTSEILVSGNSGVSTHGKPKLSGISTIKKIKPE